MTNYPNEIDDDSAVPYINNNLSELSADAINTLRDIALVLEQILGINPQGSAADVATRLSASLNPDGSIKSSALTSLGLVTLPITNSQVSATAGILESKLALDYSTSVLFADITNTNNRALSALGWINATGSKLQPHLDGTSFKHQLKDILVNTDSSLFFKNKFLTFRDNTNSFTAINDLNNETIYHQLADGSGTFSTVTTHNTLTYPSSYAHISSGIYLNTSGFATIPQTVTDLQKFAQFIDDASIFLYGTRIQNFYSSGISRASRASILGTDGYGISVVPVTSAIAYLLNTLVDSSPRDNIDNGDDIIEFKPSFTNSNNNSFDAQFNLVKIGDIVRINYGTVEVPFIIKEKKYISTGGKKYLIRIAGKNLFYSGNATARIDKPLFNTNKNGNLAISAVNNSFSATPSLLIGSPKGAEAIGVGFNVSQFDSSHYNLYLGLYPTGNPSDGYTRLPPIDVTGNLGSTPGQYTLDSIVKNTNIAFRKIGYNYRFVAFSKDGEFGIKLADSVNNVGFSIFSAVVKSNGTYDSLATAVAFPNSVIDVFPTAPLNNRPDALGFDINGSNLASPPYMPAYGAPEAAALPTKIFLPLNRETFYVNGTERDKVAIDNQQILDSLGDSYWNATVKTINPTGSRLEVTYHVPLDLSSTNLKIGKSILVQSFDGYQAADGYDIFDFGRFTISNMNVGCGVGGFTDITVYDAAHATITSPPTSVGITVGEAVRLYFGSESVSFNKESSTDFAPVTTFKRHFEVYIDQNGNSFTHERGRINIDITKTINGISLYTNSNIKTINLIKISQNLRGYQFSTVNKISLNILSYDSPSGIFSGYLCSYNGSSFTKLGKTIFGKKGEVTRFYDNSNIDFIDFLFDFAITTASFTNEIIDVQLFPSLANDGEIMLIGACQLNDVTNTVDYILDNRQFGNVSEKELSTSALDFLARPEKFMRSNGIISGFDLVEDGVNPNNQQLYIKGGKALVNGKILEVNDEIITFAYLQEYYSSTYYNSINWAVCLNSYGKYVMLPLLDTVINVTTPTVTTRLFTAFNTVNSSTYNIDSTTFSNLINNRKDLTPIYYVISAVPAVNSITLYVSDIRRYITDIDSNSDIIITSDNSSGNFKSIPAAIDWINFHQSFTNHVKLRGTFNITSPIVFDFPNFTRPVVFEGDGATINVQVDKGITFGSNVIFKNINFVYNFNTTTTSADFVNSNHGLMFGKTGSSDTLLTNFRVEGCKFSILRPDGIANNQRYSYINCHILNSAMVMSNIAFINNSFTSVLANGSDFNAAISIINASSVNDLNRPVIMNCDFYKNTCDQDQIIVATNVSSLGAVAEPGINFLNTNIENNTCGAIGFVGAGSLSSLFSGADIRNATSINLQNKINIIKNNVKYIANLDHQGKYISPTGLGFLSGNANIEKNNCSFIHVGINSFENLSQTSLILSKNILMSNLTTQTHSLDYLNNFNYTSSNFTPTVVNTRYGMYVGYFDAVNNAKSTNILIDGNQFLLGLTLGYECCLRADTCSTIVNNRFDGQASSLANTNVENSIIIYNGSPVITNTVGEASSFGGIISNNFFSRDVEGSVYAFIATYDSPTSDSTANTIVTNNIFSHSTTNHSDATSTTLCKDFSGNNLENFWIIEKNKNQIKYAIIPQNLDTTIVKTQIIEYNSFTFANQAPTYFGLANGVGDDGNVLILNDSYDASNAPATRSYSKVINLKSYLPQGCKILTVQMNAYMSSISTTIDTVTPAVFTLLLTKSQSSTQMLDVKNLISLAPSPVADSLPAVYTVTSGANVNALAAGNVPLVITTDNNHSYHLGGNYDCNLNVNLTWKRAAGAGINLQLSFSPIVLKYIW